MSTYLSVGCNIIVPELFQPIKNGNPKPSGGIWATPQDLSTLTYNSWVDFLSCYPNILFYKKRNSNPFLIPAVLIVLKDDAHIFHLTSKKDLDYLKQKYPTPDNWIDYEKISMEYDAINIELLPLCTEVDNEEQRKFAEFGVSSLILFNLNCINYYKSAQVSIEPYDYEFCPKFTDYQIIIEDSDTRKRIL